MEAKEPWRWRWGRRGFHCTCLLTLDGNLTLNRNLTLRAFLLPLCREQGDYQFHPRERIKSWV